MGQNSGSGSKFHIFGFTPLVKTKMSKEEKQEKQKANIDSSLRILLNLRIRIKIILLHHTALLIKNHEEKKLDSPTIVAAKGSKITSMRLNCTFIFFSQQYQ